MIDQPPTTLLGILEFMGAFFATVGLVLWALIAILSLGMEGPEEFLSVLRAPFKPFISLAVLLMIPIINAFKSVRGTVVEMFRKDTPTDILCYMVAQRMMAQCSKENWSLEYPRRWQSSDGDIVLSMSWTRDQSILINHLKVNGQTIAVNDRQQAQLTKSAYKSQKIYEAKRAADLTAAKELAAVNAIEHLMK